MRFLEDVYLNTRILRTRDSYGALASECLYYRKHDSLTSSNKVEKDWYLDLPREVYLPLIFQSIDLFGHVDEYTQHVIAYFLRWRIITPEINDVLNEDERTEYRDTIREVLKYIDDHTIATLYPSSQFHKNFLYSLKYDTDVTELAVQDDDGLFRFHGEPIFNPQGLGLARIVKASISDDTIIVHGKTNIGIFGKRCSLHIEDMEGNEVLVNVVHDKEKDVISFDGSVIKQDISFEVVLNMDLKYSFYTKIDGKDKKYYCKVSLDDSVDHILVSAETPCVISYLS